MKIFSRVLLATVLTTAATGCEKFLNVNDNPNTATSVTTDALLGTALATSAGNYTGGIPTGLGGGDNYNSYASFAAGYWGKTGTVSGFSEEQTYNYSSSYYQNLWNATYDNLNNYNLIQKQGATGGYPYHAAIARIMKVYNFLLLVDEYGDIPYSKALQGIGSTNPSYDKASDIYPDFIVQLKGAVADINAVGPGARSVGPEDIVFGGNMLMWKQFANSLRLRVLLRESQSGAGGATPDVVKTELKTLQSAPDGFITADVVVQPGYASNANQQNPFYNRYGFPVGSARPTAEYSFVMPTKYVIQQYVVNNDPRITQLYRLGQNTVNGTVTPAYMGATPGESPGLQFDPSGDVVGSRFLQGGTFLKSPSAPTVLMLLSEHLFSKAEAETRTLFAGGEAAAKADFLDGIKASFLFTYRDAAVVPMTLATANSTTPGASQFDAYLAANPNNPLVNYDQAATTGALGKQTVIIYQKYLAGNTVASTEGWDDYRRTTQPKFDPSTRSASPRADKLATRLLYPLSEVSTNSANVPQGVTQFMKIFWDVLD